MASQLDFGLALLLGIIPALAVLWFSLRRFSYPHVEKSLFDDRRVFFALAVGMVFGTFASVLNAALSGYDLVTSVATLLVLLVFEESFKVVYLNRKGYRAHFETTFYGVPLGTGAASTAVVASALWNAGTSLWTPSGLVLLILFSASLNLIHADTGAIVGFGTSRGETWRPLLRAAGLRAAHIGFLAPFLLASQAPFETVGIWALVSVLTSLGFAFLVYTYVYERILPGTLPDDLRRKLRRERRRGQAVKD